MKPTNSNIMKIIIPIIRFFVGVLFIFSGLVKLNDPMGFSFKLEEYFSESVFNLPALQPYALSIAVVLVIAEIVLGVLLLLGWLKKFTLMALSLMIIFFTLLTFYSAYFNKVTDCGCFGDAIPLTPWQSFGKDVILLVLILILFLGKNHIQPLFRSDKPNAIIILLTLALTSFMAYYVLNHLPLVDFRAYKVGTNIKKGMEIPENAPKSKVDIVFTYKVNGVLKNYTMENIAEVPTDAEYVSREEHIIEKGYEPPIHDFSIERDGANYVDTFLEEPKLMMLIAYNLEISSDEGLSQLNALAEKAKAKGYKVIGMTASPVEVIDQKNNQFKFNFDFYFCDGTTLKTIERANPSIVLLEYGTIVQKKHWNDIQQVNLK